MPTTYANYLKVSELLELQRPLSDGPEHDEMLFIVIHQVYELWFKEVLHELDHLQRIFEANDTAHSLHTLKRVLTILKTLVGQIDILETMTPLNFLSFRARLDAASGFESWQFRELEFALGHKRESAILHYPEGSEPRRRLRARFEAPCVWDGFLRYLALNGYAVPAAQLERDKSLPVEPSADLQRELVRVYREDPTLASVCERMVDLDEGIQEWRYRHVKMVERTIGTKRGTGGSSGAAYLATTVSRPLFPDLWAIRADF